MSVQFDTGFESQFNPTELGRVVEAQQPPLMAGEDIPVQDLQSLVPEFVSPILNGVFKYIQPAQATQAPDSALGVNAVTQSFSISDISNLNLDLTFGNVEVIQTEGDQVRVESAGGPVEATKWFSTLTVKSTSDQPFKVYVPAGPAIDVEKLGGSVRFQGVQNDVSVSTLGGDVTGTVISPNINVETVSGNIDLQWLSHPDHGRSSFQSASGNIRLGYQKGTSIWPFISSGLGTVDNSVTASTSLLFVTVESGMGNVQLYYLP